MADMYLGNESGGFDLVGTTNIKNIDFEEAKISKEDYENLSEEEQKKGVYLVTGLDDIEDGGGRADLISYDNTNSGLGSTNVQGAIDELNSNIVEQLNANMNMRYNATTDKVEVYYNGAWKTWADGNIQNVNLYNYGDENTAATGGWIAYAYKDSGSGSSVKLPSLSKESNRMKIEISSTSTAWVYGSVFTEKAIDVTNFSKLEVVVSSVNMNSNNCSADLFLATSKSNAYATSGKINISGDGTFTLDISEINGSHYFAFGIRAGNASYTGSFYVERVRLLK